MQLISLLPALLVFLYTLYKLIKDDYVFIRKGISLEQSFDIAFLGLWISLFFSRLFSIAFQYDPGQNVFLSFFSLQNNGFSLTGAVIGGLVAILIFGKLKKVPLGRFSDFLSLAFLFALPVGLLGTVFFVGQNEWLITLLSIFLYVLLIIFFLQTLYPRLMSRSLKEGTTAMLFLFFFSLISLLLGLFSALQNANNYFTPETFTLFGLFILSLVMLYKQERLFLKKRRTPRY